MAEQAREKVSRLASKVFMKRTSRKGEGDYQIQDTVES